MNAVWYAVLGAIFASSIGVIAPFCVLYNRRAGQSSGEHEATGRGPGKEEIVFRLLPATLYAYSLLVAGALGLYGRSCGGTVESPLWMLLALATTCWMLAVLPGIERFSAMLQVSLPPVEYNYFGQPTVRSLNRLYELAYLSPIKALAWSPLSAVLGLPISCMCVIIAIVSAPGSFAAFMFVCFSGSLVGMAILHYETSNMADALVTGSIASLAALLLTVLIHLPITAGWFARAHSMDDITKKYLTEQQQQKSIFIRAVMWGCPYAITVMAPTVLMIRSMFGLVSATNAYTIALTTLGLGLPLSFLTTRYLHLSANRRAKRMRERIAWGGVPPWQEDRH